MKYFYRFLKVCSFLFISFIIVMVGLYTYAFFRPKLELKTSGHFYFYDKDDTLVYQGSSSSEWVELEDISQDLIDAVISVEDKNFYRHHGFDYLRIIKSMINNIKSGKIVQGASTISMQYIKNLYLDFDQTWERKIEEAFLTLELETHYKKDDILEGYLNTINYGNGNYGVGNASQYYFNKKPADLTLEESIILAGIPKNPSNYNPQSNYEESITRAKTVASTMVKNKMIDEDTYNSLFQNPIEIYGKKEQNNLKTLMYYQDAVLEELLELKEIPDTLVLSGGLKVYTSLDMNVQKNMEESMLAHMNDETLQVASVYINPMTGAIEGLIGGKDYALSQYNRATQAKRQVGSTMKPILYYAALENGLVSNSTFLSEPTTFALSNDKSYSPTNFNNKYANQNISMATAIAYSDNIYAVKTHLFLGEDVLVNTAHQMGIQTDLQAIPSLPLGTEEINMIDFARAYTTLASGGYKRDLFFIRRVEDLEGNVLYERKDSNHLVLNPNNVYILNELLTTTYNSAFRDYNSPTALSLASKISRKYSIKTGSTSTDYWTVGYNPDALVLVWVGNDDSSPLDSSLANTAKRIWVDTMESTLKDMEPSWYETPSHVIGVPLDSITGGNITNQKKAYIYYFVQGTENGSSYEEYVSKENNSE